MIHSSPKSMPIRTDAAAYRYIIDFVYERSRIRLHENKEALIRSRLGKRIRHHGFASLVEYCDFLKNHGNQEEFTCLLDELTTNYTNFLRGENHFRFLVQKALPSLLKPGQKKFHVWSAGSSSGEEPYSIAFYLNEFFPLAQGWDWHITASDLSTKVLKIAESGIYAENRVRSLSPEWLRRYFQKGAGKWEGHYRVKKFIAERVSFKHLNLAETYRHPHPFEIIFCRNVMIYFNREARELVGNRLCDFLTPKGCLFVGLSENFHGLNLPLRGLQPGIYQHLDQP